MFVRVVMRTCLFDYDDINQWFMEEEHGRSKATEHESCSRYNKKTSLVGVFLLYGDWSQILMVRFGVKLPVAGLWRKTSEQSESKSNEAHPVGGRSKRRIKSSQKRIFPTQSCLSAEVERRLACSTAEIKNESF